MSERRRGIVQLPLRDGSTVPLRFTWAAIDGLGRSGVTELFARVDSGEPGDMAALAQLVAAASGGALTVEAVMADPPAFNDAYVAVLEAWALAARRPQGDQREANPLIRLWTSWKRFWRRHFRSA